MDDNERFSAYCDLCRQINVFFSRHIAMYCRNCQQVMQRLPDDGGRYKLVSGVFPGCCHRGAGDIFRLEGVEPCSRLSSGITVLLQKARNDKMRNQDDFELLYELENCLTGELMTGEHCRYFSACGCCLDELKGPLCINFICPPIRGDLLMVTGDDEELLGPEHDFLGIYQLLSVLGTATRSNWQRELLAFGRRLTKLDEACEQFIAHRQRTSLFGCFCMTAEFPALNEGDCY